MKRILVLFGILIFLYSCNFSGVPEGVLNQDEMKAVLKDMSLTDAYLTTISDSDSVKKVAPAYYQLVFKQHKTNLKQFEKSLNYYSTQPVLLDTMYNQIIAEFKKEKKERKKFKGLDRAKKGIKKPRPRRPLLED